MIPVYRILSWPLMLLTPRWIHLPVMRWVIRRHWRRKHRSRVAVLESGRPGSRVSRSGH